MVSLDVGFIGVFACALYASFCDYYCCYYSKSYTTLLLESIQQVLGQAQY